MSLNFLYDILVLNLMHIFTFNNITDTEIIHITGIYNGYHLFLMYFYVLSCYNIAYNIIIIQYYINM